MKTVLLLFAALLVSGCATAHLHPVQGPLATQTPPRTYAVSMDSAAIVAVTLSKGEVCRGSWSNLAKEDPTERDLSAEWDLVYGNGAFAANVLGTLGIARAILTCTSGMTMNVEFNSTKGVAKDSNGNVFKLTF
ncbi:MAG TPA: hypothetical protein VK727_14710 [Steroidobacteraceae bacterium]|jgi:hypothetical protein|nr:hypothetical protein [Steroidobacteraceae bacterium]